MSETEQTKTKQPSLFRNYISFVGAAISSAALVSVVLLFLVEITSHQENPYLGILTYIIFPSILIFGLAVVILGRMLERRRRHKASPTEVAAYPKLDLNDRRARRAFFVFLTATFLFICASCANFEVRSSSALTTGADHEVFVRAGFKPARRFI